MTGISWSFDYTPCTSNTVLFIVFFGLSWSMMMVCWPEAEKEHILPGSEYKTFIKGSSIMMFGSEFLNRIRKIWKVDKDLVDSNKKMGSNVPLLRLSGDYNHVCANQHAQKLAKNFDTAYNYVFKGIAHSPVDAGPCGINKATTYFQSITIQL